MKNVWRPVGEELPECGLGVLITDGKTIASASLDSYSFSKDGEHRTLNIWTSYGFSGYEWEFDFQYSDITHWMPLPEPPT